MTCRTTLDAVVAGATPSGISASIAAARRGLAVALVDPLPGPGQMLSNGLCVFDTAHRAGVTGIMSEFAARVADHHRRHYGDDPKLMLWRFRFDLGERMTYSSSRSR